MKKIAIMQPTFLPWIGYIAMMDHVDEFVFLDHVPINKRSWQTRNKIKTPAGEQLISVPVNAHQGQSIGSVTIAGSVDKISRAIMQNYIGSPYYLKYGMEIINILSKKHHYLCSLNLHLLEYFIKEFGIKTKFSCSSDLNLDTNKSELLADICRLKKADEYISAPGSKEYLDESVFDCPVSYFNYDHPVYKQRHGDFLPYMSIVDFLCNEGANIDLIRTGISGDTGTEGIKADTGEEHEDVPRETDNPVDDRSRDRIGSIQ